MRDALTEIQKLLNDRTMCIDTRATNHASPNTTNADN